MKNRFFALKKVLIVESHMPPQPKLVTQIFIAPKGSSDEIFGRVKHVFDKKKRLVFLVLNFFWKTKAFRNIKGFHARVHCALRAVHTWAPPNLFLFSGRIFYMERKFIRWLVSFFPDTFWQFKIRSLLIEFVHFSFITITYNFIISWFAIGTRKIN